MRSKIQYLWRQLTFFKPVLAAKLPLILVFSVFASSTHAGTIVPSLNTQIASNPLKTTSLDSVLSTQGQTQNITEASQSKNNIEIALNRPVNIRDDLLAEIDRKALSLLQTGQLSEARKLISEAIDATDFAGNVSLLVNRLIIRASIDQQVGSYIGALQDLQFAFRLASSTNQQELIADIAFIIASIHQSRNEHSIALSYAQQAFDTYEKLGPKQPIPVLLLSISSLLATRQIDEAFSYLNQLAPILAAADIAISQEQSAFVEQLKQQKAEYFQYLGEAELYKENIDESIAALEIAVKLNHAQAYQQLAKLNLLLSQAYTFKDNMDLAIKHLVDAFNLAGKSSSSFYLNQALQLHRATLLSQLNEFEAAYKVTQDVLKNRDLNQPISEIKRMLDMHANFQLNLQQIENNELKEENLRKGAQIETKQTLNKLYFLIIGLLFCTCCLLLLLFIRGKKHRLSLEKIAHSDALTGLHSRTRVLELFAYHQDLFNRNKQTYCVAIVDLDFFKKINDNYGHQTGDEVLKMFGELSKRSFRKTDILGRIGGEEFLFILPNTKDEQALEVFQQFNKKLSTIGERLKLDQIITASIGLVCPHPQEEPKNIIKRADAALYEAKHKGRNCVVFGNKVVSLQSPSTEVN